MTITREIRFSLRADGNSGDITNSWAGWPVNPGLAPFLRLQATAGGEVDPQTGYLCNISLLDEVLRKQAIPVLRAAWLSSEHGQVACERVLASVWDAIEPDMPAGTQLVQLCLLPTTFLQYCIHAGDRSMVSVTQSFEFSAAHRLYCADLDEETNRRIFGKCTNPSGHGHNYVVEVTVRGAPDSASGQIVALADLESVVKQHVIDVFDHKHLNQDCPEFADLNPSVENITRVIFDKLTGQFDRAELETVRVYETPKTWAEVQRST